MSCNTSDGNRLVLSLAKHAANSANPDSEAATLSVIQHMFHTLTREGRSLGIPAPQKTEVITWVQEQEGKILDTVPSSYSQQKDALKDLATAHDDIANRDFLPDGPTFHAWKYTVPLAHYRASQADNPNAKVIALDLDGCIYDYNYVLREWLVSRGWDRQRLEEPRVYSLKEAWGIDQDLLIEEMQTAIRAGKMFNEGPFMADGLAGARSLGLAGHVLSVISARSLPGVEEQASRGTTTWLRENGLHVDRLLLVSPSNPKEKLERHFDLLIDDHPGNVKIALENGRNAILLDRLWNKDVDLPRATYDEIVENLDSYL